MAETNKQVLLAARPVGLPKETDFNIVETPLPEPEEGQFLVRIIYLSVDPYMAGRMRARKSYAPSLEIGDVMIGGAVGEVVDSRHPDYGVGEFVEGMFGWREFALSDGSEMVRKVDPELAPLSTSLYALGMPGMTAYFGLLEIAKLKPGESVVVSGAAGAVGALAGQIAKNMGCRVVGVAGSGAKVDYVTGELGYDAAFNYKTTDDYTAKLAELCPGGIDVYFDNVGGAITDAVIANINVGARVAICGQISQYNLTRPAKGPRWLMQLIVKQARVEGFLVYQFLDRYAEGMTKMAEWLRDGKIRYREQIAEGIDNAPRAFIGLFTGENLGKQLVRISGQ